MPYRVKSVFSVFVFLIYRLVRFPVQYQYRAVFSRFGEQVYSPGYRSRQIRVKHYFFNIKYVQASLELFGYFPALFKYELFLFVFRLRAAGTTEQNVFAYAVRPCTEPAARVAVSVPFSLELLGRLAELGSLAPQYFPGRIEFRKELMDECRPRHVRYLFSANDGRIAVVVFCKRYLDS